MGCTIDNIKHTMAELIVKSSKQSGEARYNYLVKNGVIVSDAKLSNYIGSKLTAKKAESRSTKIAELRKLTGSVERPEISTKEERKATPLLDSLPKYNNNVKSMVYAGIGSRQTDDAVLAEMTKIAKELESAGYKLQTGKTFGNEEEGADKAFSDGSTNKELFGPEDIKIGSKEWQIAQELHPNFEALTKDWNGNANSTKGTGGAKLMARNTNQIFGKSLDTIVDFVLFAAEETNNPLRPKGGTGQAVEMARRKGIPTINMLDADWKEQLDKVVSSTKIKNKGITVTPKGKAGYWSRKEAMSNPDKIYVFAENGEESSGHNVIKSGRLKGKKYPTATQAVVRGLENTVPLFTVVKPDGKSHYSDSELKDKLSDTVRSIKEHIANGKEVILAGDGYGTGVSNMSQRQKDIIHSTLNKEFGTNYEVSEDQAKGEAIKKAYNINKKLQALGAFDTYSAYINKKISESAAGKLLFHGTTVNDIKSLKESAEGRYGKGVYLTDNLEEAKIFAFTEDQEDMFGNTEPGVEPLGNVLAAYTTEGTYVEAKELRLNSGQSIEFPELDNLIIEASEVSDLRDRNGYVMVLGRNKNIMPYNEFVVKGSKLILLGSDRDVDNFSMFVKSQNDNKNTQSTYDSVLNDKILTDDLYNKVIKVMDNPMTNSNNWYNTIMNRLREIAPTDGDITDTEYDFNNGVTNLLKDKFKAAGINVNSTKGIGKAHFDRLFGKVEKNESGKFMLQNGAFPASPSQNVLIENMRDKLIRLSSGNTLPTKDRFSIVQGMGGTGKSTSIGTAITEAIKEVPNLIVFGATPTHTAKHVLIDMSQHIPEENMRSIKTFDSLLLGGTTLTKEEFKTLKNKERENPKGFPTSINYTFDSHTDLYVETKGQFGFIPSINNLKVPSVFVLDEISMLDDEKMLKLIAILNAMPQLQVIALGDYHQLPPVSKDTKISPMLNSLIFNRGILVDKLGKVDTHEVKEQHRQDPTSLLYDIISNAATLVENKLPAKGKDNFVTHKFMKGLSSGNGVEFIKDSSMEGAYSEGTWSKIINKFKSDTVGTKYLAFNNKTLLAFNKEFRKRMFGKEAETHPFIAKKDTLLLYESGMFVAPNNQPSTDERITNGMHMSIDSISDTVIDGNINRGILSGEFVKGGVLQEYRIVYKKGLPAYEINVTMSGLSEIDAKRIQKDSKLIEDLKEREEYIKKETEKAKKQTMIVPKQLLAKMQGIAAGPSITIDGAFKKALRSFVEVHKLDPYEDSSKVIKVGPEKLDTLLGDNRVREKPLSMVAFNYAYAFTTYKAQGQTIKNVIYETAASRGGNGQNKGLIEAMDRYTAVSRAKESIMILGNSSKLALFVHGDGSTTEKPKNEKNTNQEVAEDKYNLAEVNGDRIGDHMLSPWAKGAVWVQRLSPGQAKYTKSLGMTEVKNFGNPFTTIKVNEGGVESATALGTNGLASNQYYEWLLNNTIPENYKGNKKSLAERREFILNNLDRINSATKLHYLGTAKDSEVNHVKALIKISEMNKTKTTNKNKGKSWLDETKSGQELTNKMKASEIREYYNTELKKMLSKLDWGKNGFNVIGNHIITTKNLAIQKIAGTYAAGVVRFGSEASYDKLIDQLKEGTSKYAKELIKEYGSKQAAISQLRLNKQNSGRTESHELLHGLTADWIDANPNDPIVKRLEQLLKDAKEYAKTLPDDNILNTELDGYWKQDTKEFIAEMLAKPELLMELNKKEYNTNKSFVTKFTELITAILKAYGLLEELDAKSMAAELVRLTNEVVTKRSEGYVAPTKRVKQEQKLKTASPMELIKMKLDNKINDGKIC